MAITPYSFSPRVSWLTLLFGRRNSATLPQLATTVFPTLCRECHLISCSSGFRLYNHFLHIGQCGGYAETKDCIELPSLLSPFFIHLGYISVAFFPTTCFDEGSKTDPIPQKNILEDSVDLIWVQNSFIHSHTQLLLENSSVIP